MKMQKKVVITRKMDISMFWELGSNKNYTFALRTLLGKRCHFTVKVLFKASFVLLLLKIFMH